jgi:AAA15 family ATPase/GTPase
MYCRVFPENKSKDSKSEFEIFKNNKYYAYGFTINLHEQIITSEWLYELIPQKASQLMLFERETKTKRMELGSNILLDETDSMRFKTYKLDFEDNISSLFLKEMNRNKKINSDSKLTFFRDIFEWFDEDLVTIFPDQPITDFEYFYGDGDSGNVKINEIIESFDTCISKVKIEKIAMVDLKNKLPNNIVENIIETFKKKIEESMDNTQIRMSLRTSTAFYNFKGPKGEEPVITTIMLEHGNSSSDFEFSEESDGTRRLFDLLDILISNKKNVSRLYSLDRIKERYDKKLSKAYLDGRYGAIPVLKKFSFKDGEEQ